MSPASPVRRTPERSAHAWLRALCHVARGPIDAQQFAILVAHPGDETIGCGAQLRRLRNAGVIVLTDGTRRDFSEGNPQQLQAAEIQAAVRLAELQRALKFSGLGIERLLVCGASEHQAALQLPALARQIAAHVKRNQIRCLLTLAYEGGHPDRDSAAFVASIGAALLARQRYVLRLLEMPIAHRRDTGCVTQCFADDGHVTDQRELDLNADEQRFKRNLISIYTTRRDSLRRMDCTHERFRVAPHYDFSAAPNRGRLIAEHYAVGVNHAGWLTLARDAMRELGLKSERTS